MHSLAGRMTAGVVAGCLAVSMGQPASARVTPPSPNVRSSHAASNHAMPTTGDDVCFATESSDGGTVTSRFRHAADEKAKSAIGAADFVLSASCELRTIEIPAELVGGPADFARVRIFVGG